LYYKKPKKLLFVIVLNSAKRLFIAQKKRTLVGSLLHFHNEK